MKFRQKEKRNWKIKVIFFVGFDLPEKVRGISKNKNKNKVFCLTCSQIWLSPLGFL
jgi:hypothetical protein